MVVNVNHHNMGDDENRSRLFDEIKNFSQRKLKQVQTKVTTGSGEHVTEKRSPKGVDAIKNEGVKGPGYVVDTKPDLQVGMIIPGLFIASQDVAQDRTLLNQYEITHILNLAYGVENAFEDDFNYKKLDILDVPETDITQYFDECFDFIDEGIHQRNCLVHCNAGVSRSTAICCAYLMKKQKMKYKDALALVREARAFARPNDGFAKQLEDYDDKIFGQFEAPDSNEDAFIAKKRAEREAEKAAILGTVSVKNRLNKFGAQLESVYANRLQDAQPVKLPLKRKPAATATTTAQQQSAPPPKRTSSIKSKTAGPPPPPPPPNFNAPAPPPPPPPPSNVKAPPPPPPPVAKKAVSNKAVTPLAKEPEKPRKVITNKTAVATPKPVESVPEEYQKSENPNVDETAITVAAQRKLWESAMQANPLNNGNHVSVPKVQTTPATPNNVNKSKFSWQQSQAPTANAAPSPEPEKKSKKIILKQRKDSVTPAEEPRRSTRDLVEALEAVSASNSQSPSPYSSPAQPRRQLQYGRRAQTSQIGDSKPQQQPVPKAKPTWGLRETVDSLADSSGSPQTTPRCRSPLTNSISSTPRQSHSPSPSRNSADSDASCASTSRPKVFGRVPPRKVSLSGNAANSNSTSSNHSNEFPVVPSAPSVSSAKSAAPTPLSSSVTASSNTSSATKTREPRKSKLAVYESCQPASSKEVEKVSQPASQPASAKPSSQLASAKPSNQPDSAKASSQPTSAKPSNQPVIPEPSVSSTASDEPTDGLRTGFKKVPLGETKQKSTNRSVEARRNRSGLNRSSTAEILKLIKTKSRADFGRSMETVDEDIEIDYLLNELEKEGLDAIDWDLIGVNEDEVKNIVETNRVTDGDDNGIEDGESSEESSESSEEESSSEESSDEEEEMQHTVFASPATTSSTQAASSSSNGQPAAPVKHTSAAVIKLAPPKPQPQPKLEVEEEEEESSEEEESEEETEEETDSD